jgi:hypothetical protein
MKQAHSVIKAFSGESKLPERVDNSLAIDSNLNRLQAIGELMSVCSEEGVEAETIKWLGVLIRNSAEEIKALWLEETIRPAPSQ